MIENIVRLAVLCGSVVIVLVVFRRFVEESWAVRGLVALGFVGLFLCVCTVALARGMEHAAPAFLLGAAFPLGVVVIVEGFGRKD